MPHRLITEPDRLVPLAVRVVAIVALLAAVGALAGVVWEQLWTPPIGLVVEERWVLEPAGPDHAFSGTGWYVVIATVAGLVTAALVGWLWSKHEVTTLLAVAAGSLLAGWLMFTVGHALGPADPQVLAVGKDDLTRIPSDLTVAGSDTRPDLLGLESSAFVSFPAGALTGLAVVFLTSNGRRAGSGFEQPPRG